MAEYGVYVELGAPFNLGFKTEDLTTLAEAVRQVSENAHREWRAYALGAPLPSGQVIHPRSGTYERSILLRQTGPFSAEVFSELPYADAIENGTKPRDLKRMLDSSFKVRTTKTGKRYLIIPFRHDAPGTQQGHAMPQAVHDWWKGKVPTHITGSYQRLSGTGAFDIATRKLITVPSRTYGSAYGDGKWGDRLTKPVLEALGVGERQAARLAGMVNFRRPGRTGGSAHSKFLTFRVMMEGSSGWISPAQPGKFPARTVSDAAQPVAERAFAAAVSADIARYLGGVVE